MVIDLVYSIIVIKDVRIGDWWDMDILLVECFVVWSVWVLILCCVVLNLDWEINFVFRLWLIFFVWFL